MSSKFSAPQAYSDAEYEPIPMQPVTSKQIAAIGYSESRKVLAIQFSRGNGAIYHYPGVTQKTHDDMMAAESKGVFFGEHIKSLPFDKFPAPEKAA